VEDSRRILDSIRRIVQGLRVSSRAAEQEFGLSSAQLFVLQKLAESDAASVNELAARTLTHQSSVSVVVQKLVDRGLISRSPAEEDARRVMLSLTPAGRRLISRSPQATQDALIAAIERFSPRQRRNLATLLETLAAGAAGDALPPPMFFEDRQSTPTKKSNDSR
jgi:DNA-binding MarR family transcriptional regulator